MKTIDRSLAGDPLQTPLSRCCGRITNSWRSSGGREGKVKRHQHLRLILGHTFQLIIPQYLSKGGFESSHSRFLARPGNDALEDLSPERDIFWRQNIFGPILFY